MEYICITPFFSISKLRKFRQGNIIDQSTYLSLPERVRKYFTILPSNIPRNDSTSPTTCQTTTTDYIYRKPVEKRTENYKRNSLHDDNYPPRRREEDKGNYYPPDHTYFGTYIVGVDPYRQDDTPSSRDGSSGDTSSGFSGYGGGSGGGGGASSSWGDSDSGSSYSSSDSGSSDSGGGDSGGGDGGGGGGD